MVVRRINQAFQRADQIEHAEGKSIARHWFAPIVADAEAGFGGNLNAFELMKQMIEAGAAGVHFEDQLSSSKKCGHMGGKVLVPTREFIEKLVAARLAADVMGVPTSWLRAPMPDAARILTSDVDERDQPFLTGERTSEGFHMHHGRDRMRESCPAPLYAVPALVRDIASGPRARRRVAFAESVHREYPGQAPGVQLLAIIQLASGAG